MILSTTSTDRAARPEILPSASQAEPVLLPRRDRISTECAAYLRGALQRQPAVRPEVVARAKALAADPNYPPVEVLRKVSEQILQAPDLSEDAT